MMDQVKGPSLVSSAVTYTGRGGYDVIRIADRPVRAPEAGEVRISVRAAAVNPTDILLRDPAPGVESWPVVPGVDAAGIIESVGPGVTRLHVGQKVMAVAIPRRLDGGAQAQHIVVPAASVASIPTNATLSEAATLPMNGLTALLSLELANLEAGQFLAISGGAGLLAHYTIALAKRRKLKVIADAKPAEIELVRSYGADEVVERSEDFAAAVRRVAPDGAHALLDTAVLGEKAFGALRDNGVYLPVRMWGNKPGERDLTIKQVLVYGAFERTEWLDILREMVEAGKIRLRVTREYTIHEVADAQRALEAGGLRGRPVIVL
jgi:NADPH:quinone reductase-like Zn-dependent oxidoreductase